MSDAQTTRPLTVLVDNDPLVIMTWKLSAKRSGAPLESHSAPEALLERARRKEYAAETRFYLDSDLDYGVKGETIAAELLTLGYRWLYIASGHPAEKFKHLTYLAGVIGKDPPF